MLPVNLDTAVLVPEKVIITYRLANLGTRITAHILDLIVATAGIALLSTAIAFIFSRIDEGVMTLLLSLVVAFGYFAYFSLFEGLWNGQTLGKKATNIRVRSADGTPVSFAAALYRNLLRPADFFPFCYLTGLVAIFSNPQAQRIGDLAAGTIVTFEPRAVPRFSPAPHKYGLHPFEADVGELRGMTIEEYFAVKRLCDRFPELPTRVQEQNLRELWEPFARVRQVPQIPNVHPVYLMEAVVMRFGRQNGLL